MGLPKKPEVIRDHKQSEHIKKLRDPTQTNKIPRIDLYQKLLDTYEAERFRWAQFKNDTRPKEEENPSQDRWNAYDRLLTTYAPVIDAKLEALWAVLLVRGQYHRVRKYISYVDIQTAGKALQRAKESLRASVSRSIDDTEDIYPVVFTPNNWAKYLSTNFRPEDLLANVENTRNRLLDAQKERSLLILRRDALTAGRQDIKALEKAATDPSNALRTVQATMVKSYNETAAGCIQRYFEFVTKQAKNKLDAVNALADSNNADLNKVLAASMEPPLTDAQWKSLVDMQKKCIQCQMNVMTANDAYSEAQLAAAKARGADPSNSLEVLNENIQSLTIDIEYYEKMLQASTNPLGVPVTKIGADGKLEAVATDPEDGSKDRTPEDAPAVPPSRDGASVWQLFVIESKESQSTSTKLSSTAVSHSDWSTSLWFASGGGHSDSASSKETKQANMSNTDIQVGFRAMKVTIDRPWFNAQLLGQTKEFFNFNANQISAGDPKEIHDKMKNGEPVEHATDSLIPSWSTAFIVVKDVHIVMTAHESFEASEIEDMKNSSASGGGFLCFQASKSSSSSDHRDAFSMKSSDKKISIRIPAPQILGWVSQLTLKDESVKSYMQFREGEFEKPAPKGNSTASGDLPSPPKTP